MDSDFFSTIRSSFHENFCLNQPHYKTSKHNQGSKIYSIVKVKGTNIYVRQIAAKLASARAWLWTCLKIAPFAPIILSYFAEAHFLINKISKFLPNKFPFSLDNSQNSLSRFQHANLQSRLQTGPAAESPHSLIDVFSPDTRVTLGPTPTQEPSLPVAIAAHPVAKGLICPSYTNIFSDGTSTTEPINSIPMAKPVSLQIIPPPAEAQVVNNALNPNERQVILPSKPQENQTLIPNSGLAIGRLPLATIDLSAPKAPPLSPIAKAPVREKFEVGSNKKSDYIAPFLPAPDTGATSQALSNSKAQLLSSLLNAPIWDSFKALNRKPSGITTVLLPSTSNPTNLLLPKVLPLSPFTAPPLQNQEAMPNSQPLNTPAPSYAVSVLYNSAQVQQERTSALSPISPSVDTKTKPSDISLPIQPTPPTRYNSTELSEILQELAKCDGDLATLDTPIKKLAAEFKSLSLDLIIKKIGDYRDHLVNILTVKELKQSDDYLEVYITFLAKHPKNTLFPTVTLQDTTMPVPSTEMVDKLLMCVASTKFELACQNDWIENRNDSFGSPLFNNGVLQEIVKHVHHKKNKIFTGREAQIELQFLLDIYHAAHELGMDKLLTFYKSQIYYYFSCRQLSSAPLITLEELNALWFLAEFYEDTSLRALSVQNALHAIHECSLESIPEPLLALCKMYKNIEPFLYTAQDACFNYNSSLGICNVNVKIFNEEIVKSCKAIGIEHLTIDTRILDCSIFSFYNCFKSLELSVWDNKKFDDFCNVLKLNLTLERLKIHATHFQEAEIAKFADSLASNVKLVDLTFWTIALTSKGYKYLSDALMKNKSLVSLSLNNADLNDEALNNLVEGVNKNKKLRVLSLKSNNLSPQAIATFNKALENRRPTLQINWESDQAPSTHTPEKSSSPAAPAQS